MEKNTTPFWTAEKKNKLVFLLWYIILAVASFGIQLALMWIASKISSAPGRDDALTIIIWFFLYISAVIGYLTNTYRLNYNIVTCFLALLGIYIGVIWYCSIPLLSACCLLLIYNLAQFEHIEYSSTADIPAIYFYSGGYVLYALTAYFAMGLLDIKPAMSTDEMYILLVTAIFIGLRPLFQTDGNSV